MTHTLHRSGSSQSLKTDYVVLAIASQTVDAGDRALSFRRFADVVLKHHPLNFGDMRTGNRYQLGLETIHDGYDGHSIVHAVFADEKTVASVLKELKEVDLGLSIVVSGLFKQTTQSCLAAGLKPHTVQYALGVFGRTDLLPQPWILELSTMCGHGMVSFSLIEHLAQRIRGGHTTVEAAAAELTRQCHCGVFNPARAMRILKRTVRQGKDKDGPEALKTCGHHRQQKRES